MINVSLDSKRGKDDQEVQIQEQYRSDLASGSQKPMPDLDALDWDNMTEQ